MKRISNWAIIALLAFSSCAKEFNYDPTEDIKENAENIFGIIDPNQDWRTVTSGTVTVTANAALDDIAKVQILTESPFFNDQAKILAEADVTAGQTVTLSYDAPRSNSRLIAACVDSNGKYYIKGFNLDDKEVSFNSSSSVATTRGLGITRGSSDLPDLSGVVFNYNNSFLSYNALRTANPSSYPSWIGKSWDSDRLWWPSGSVNSDGWILSNSTIYRDATGLSAQEEATLQDIFNASLYRDDPKGHNGRRDNLKLIREGNAVKLFNNHLVSNGKTPLTLCPVQLASTEAYWCDIYYYYYKTEDIPAGTSEADYIKSLPKFKAIDLNDERLAFKAKTNIAITARDETFLRLHEYILPFYGNASEFEFVTVPASLSSNGYITDGKFYRIYNYSGNAKVSIPESNHYITYGTKTENLKAEYSDNIEYQLWQVFTNANDNSMMLYNVGAKKFLWWNNGDYIESKDIVENSLKNYTIYLTDESKNPYALNDITKQNVFILSSTKGNFIKALIDTGREYLFRGGLNVSGDYRVPREWTFEVYDYKGSTATPITDFALPAKLYPAESIIKPSATPSAIIPEGYHIGFLIRKDNGDKTSNISSDKHGCLYGYGELNTEINTFGQFKSSVTQYGMAENDPRIATFTANDKVYLCFEEGADTQYSDVIVEIGSRGETGVYMFDDVQEVANQPYTMCFEDRPNVADYDMNDVVLRCIRKSSTELELSLIATGAQDQVYIEGIEGTFVSGTDLNNKEVHDLFGVSTSQFVNTQLSASVVNAVTATYEVSESITIPQFLSNIFIRNISMNGNEIRVPKTGEPPFALIIPGDFDYPIEQVSIVNAYSAFETWATNANNYGAWLNSFDENKIYPNPFTR